MQRRGRNGQTQVNFKSVFDFKSVPCDTLYSVHCYGVLARNLVCECVH